MLVKFTRSHTPYLAGETAGFDETRARALIKLGVAVEHDAKAAAPAEVGGSDVPISFDPASADLDAVRSFLMERNVKFHSNTGEAKLRAMAADVLAAG